MSQLELADTARAEWYAHTAESRAAALRATAELSARRAEDGREEQLVTAEEWLAEHTAAMRTEDVHRTVTADVDLAEVVEQRAAELHETFAEPSADAAETAVADIREAAAEPAGKAATADAVRGPSADETAESIRRAQQALAEIRERQAADAQRAAEEARSEQLARWHADEIAESERVAEREDDAALVRAPS